MKHALHFPRIGKTLLAAALVAMAGTAAADQSLLGKLGSIFGASTDTKAAASKGIEGDIDAAKALAFLYGNVQTTQGEEKNFGMPLSKEWALWKNPQCSNVKYSSMYAPQTCPQEAKVHSVFDAKYTEQSKEKYIILTKTGDVKNMGNPNIFGAAVFVKEGGQWALEVENKYISPDVPTDEAEHGCHLANDYDKPSLARVGPDKHAILIHAGSFPAHHYSNCPTVLLPEGGSIRSVPIGVFEYGYSSTGVAQGVEYGERDVRASFDEQSAGEYYDAVVRYIDASNDGKAASRRFQFRDGAYHKVTTPKAAKKGAKKRK